MTVDELISELRKLDGSAEVWIRIDAGESQPASYLDTVESVELDEDGDVMITGETYRA